MSWNKLPIDERRLADMVKAGKSDKEIGDTLGFDARRIAERRCKLGLRSQRAAFIVYTDAEIGTLEAMWRAKEPLSAIAKAIDRSEKSVWHKARALGLRQSRPVAAVPKDSQPMEPTVNELTARQEAIAANRRHLADLVREYGGGTLGEAKAIYVSRNELNILPDPSAQTSFPTREYLSACSSPAAWVV